MARKKTVTIDLRAAGKTARATKRFVKLFKEAIATKKGKLLVHGQIANITATGSAKGFEGLAAFLGYAGFLETAQLRKLIGGTIIPNLYEKREARIAKKKAKKGKPYRIKVLETLAELVVAIGNGTKTKNPGGYHAEYKLWDGRIVRANSIGGDVKSDVHFGDDVVLYDHLLPYVQRLLNEHSIVISDGSDDQVCTTKWTVSAE